YAAEIAHGTNPFLADTDGDGLSDGAEVNTYGTNPLLTDTDDDGFGDGDEIAAGTNPPAPPPFPVARPPRRPPGPPPPAAAPRPSETTPNSRLTPPPDDGKKARMDLRWTALCALVCAFPALADPAPAHLVKDIDTTPLGSVPAVETSVPITNGNGVAYFIGAT